MPSEKGALTTSLEMLSERAGDPSQRIYAELFRRHPEFESLFFLDTNGDVRGEMLSQAFDLLMRADADDETADVMVRANRFTHDGYGVSADEFNSFFSVIRDVSRQALDAAWTEQFESRWTEVISQLTRSEP